MEKRKLYSYQSKAAWYLYRKKRQALFAGLGSGKTAIMLYVLEKLLAECSIRHVLVVAPIAVCKSVWRQEAQEWDRTKWLEFSLVVGSKPQREKALAQEADIYLSNYESMSWLINYKGLKPDFDVLVLDESTMVQAYGSVRFAGKGKRVNPKWKDDHSLSKFIPPVKGLKKVVGDFERVYLISGTPKSGDYIGLWSQMYCLDQGAALQPTITKFKNRYYYKYGPEFYQIKLKDNDAKKEIQNRLKPLCYRISSKDVAAVLPKVVERTHLIDLSRKVRKIYTELEDDFFAEVENQPITVDNIAVKSNKLQQVCNGAIYDDDRNVIKLHNGKIEMLDALLNDLGGERALVIYAYIHDIDRLLVYDKHPILKSSMPDREFNKIVDEWNAGKHQIIYGHPKSMSHGLNLQGGGFNIIFFGLTWSLDRYQQSIGRLRRSGQRVSVVKVHRIAARNTVEDLFMLPRLKLRSQSQKEFLDSFNRYKKARISR